MKEQYRWKGFPSNASTVQCQKHAVFSNLEGQWMWKNAKINEAVRRWSHVTQKAKVPESKDDKFD